jgi:hypothetical protein
MIWGGMSVKRNISLQAILAGSTSLGVFTKSYLQ